MRGNGRVVLVLVALCVLATKIAIAYNTYGTNDAITFDADIRKLESAGPKELYLEGVEPEPGRKQPFSHSPPVIHGLLLLKRLQEKSGLPVRFWMRVCCAFADLASLAVLWKIGIRSTSALLLTALAPVSLMVSGFHVNTDPLVSCAVLSCACLIRSRRFAWAGTALSVALSIKLLALVFVPALAIAAGAKKSCTIAAVAIACFCGLSMPFLWQFPKTIGASMLTYAGLYLYWGIPGISLLLGTHGANPWYKEAGKFVALGAVGVAASAVRYRGRREAVLSNCGLSAALFLVFTPGFGVQYLVYLVPWIAIIRIPIGVGFYLISGAFMAAFYTWGSKGFPWYLADFLSTRFMPVHVFFLGVLTWIAVGALAIEFARTALGRLRSGAIHYGGPG